MNFVQKTFSELPENIQNFLVDATLPEWAKKTVASFGLSQEKIAVLMEIAERVTLDESLLEILPGIILSELEVDWETACKIAVDLAGHRLLPLALFIEADIEKQIRDWGGDPAVFKNVPHLEPMKEDPAEMVTRILTEMETKLPDHLEQSRLEFILTSMVKGERTAEETKAAFMRPLKVGGLALDETKANLFLSRFLEKTGGLSFDKSVVVVEAPKPIMFRDVRPPVYVPPPVIKTVVPVSAPSPQPSPVVAPGEGESVGNPVPSATPSLPSKTSVPGPVSPTPPQQNSNSNPSHLHQIDGGGDLGWGTDATEIAAATAMIKEKISPVSKPVLSANDAVEKIMIETGLKLDETNQKKFVAIIEARLKDIRDAFETRSVLERSVEQGGLAISGLQLAKTTELLEEIVSDWQKVMRTESDKNKQTVRETKLAEEARKKTEAKAAVQAAKPKIMPKPIVPVMNTNSTVAAQSSRPILNDITPPARKLAGPIDELQNLTLEEFRRLSSDPKEAKLKIKDKIDLLEEQGMGQKILGIKAWHSSPVSRLYLEMTKAALLSSKTIEDISAERSRLNQETLSSTEVKAINELNGSLRF